MRLPFAASNAQAELILSAFDRFLERTANGGRHAGRMPVKAENATQTLEPVGIGNALENFFRSVIFDNQADDFSTQPDHSLE